MTKKIFLAMAVVASMASCTDDYKDWTDPQTVNQPEIVVFGDGSVTPVSSVIDFANIGADESMVKVCDISAPTSTSESFSPFYNISIGDQTFNLTSEGYMSFSELKEYVINTYGKAPVVRDLTAVVNMWSGDNDVSVKTASSQQFTLQVKPDAPFIDTGYWLVGDFASWDAAGALPFTHVGGDADVYEAPTFTITFTTSADNQYWKIIPQNNYAGDFWAEGEKGVVGTTVDGDTSMSGSLTTSGPQAGKIGKAGIYRMTINMMEYTYTIEELAFNQFVYFIGATDGWSAAEQKLETVNYDGNYTGFLYMADPNGWGNEFKFQKTPGDWGTEINSGHMTGGISGDLADGGGNFKATAGEGIYYVELNLATNTLKGTRINNMNLVGDFNGWNAGDDAQQMTWDAENYCYVINNAGVTANGWKFTANNSWDINLGGDNLNELVANGSNLSATGSTIKLYPTRKTSAKIYCTVE